MPCPINLTEQSDATIFLGSLEDFHEPVGDAACKWCRAQRDFARTYGLRVFVRTTPAPDCSEHIIGVEMADMKEAPLPSELPEMTDDDRIVESA